MRDFRIIVLLSFILLNLPSSAQDLLLLTEDFESGGAAFSLNNGGPGSNSGSNQWVVNSQYNGSGGCSNTPNQSNTSGGTIGGAPLSQYLHIQNTTAPSTNACFEQSQPSDQFAYLTEGFCTYGLDEIHISFFWIGEGSADASGSLWYQTDGGGWNLIAGNLNNSSVWQYEDITNPAFSNVGSLQFAFRFENGGSGNGAQLSFGVDDVNVVATLSTANPIDISITSVAPNPVCEGNYLTIEYQLSDALCDGIYLLELSNNGGTYPSPFSSWAVNINYPTTTGSVTILLPPGAAAGNCYTVRLSRTSPEPAITGTASACFEIIECPNVITTAPIGPPVVTMDPLPVCVGSVIDVPIFATGVYNANNAYVCQLSEPDGTFSASPPIVGSSPDASTYDPTIAPFMPGNVSGIIPDTEPGCNYYLRVISTSPSTVGTIWGPFCIQRCDVTTNDQQDISFCITECAADPNGDTEQIILEINTNNQTVQYGPGNVFTTQLFSSQSFTQIGSDGILGEVVADENALLDITVPCLEDAIALGIPIGMNYLRLRATDPSDNNNTVSTLIRITVGTIISEPQIITSYDYTDFSVTDTFCADPTGVSASIYLTFSPYDPMDGSTYLWSCSGINNGAAFESPNGAGSNVLLVTANLPTVLDFSIQRTNNGCVSSWTPEHSVVVAGPPVVFIQGQTPICLGDTVSYQVPFSNNTYYSWSTDALPEFIAYQDTSSNVLNLAFNTAGTYGVYLNVLNECGASDDDLVLNVVDPPEANAGPDMTVCTGDEAILSLATGTSFNYSWASDAGNISNTNNTPVVPAVDTEYYGTVTTNLGCTDTDTVLVTLAFPEPPVNYFDSICPGGANTIILESDSTGTYTWSTGSTDYYAEISDTGTYSLSVQTLFMECPHYAIYNITATEPSPPIMLTDSVCPGGSAFITLQADAPGDYQWNTGQSLPYINVNEPGIYIVTISGGDAPCPRTLHFTITPDSCIVIPPDTIPYEEIWAWVPNSFTLNNDGLNDVFGPVFSNTALVRDYRFIVYDRWGNAVYSSSDPYEKWTGSFQGGAHYAADGAYNWQLFFRGEFEVNSKSSSGIVIVSR